MDQSPILRITSTNGSIVASQGLGLDTRSKNHHCSESNVNTTSYKNKKPVEDNLLRRTKSTASSHDSTTRLTSQKDNKREHNILALLKVVNQKRKNESLKNQLSVTEKTNSIDVIDIYDKLQQKTQDCHWKSPVLAMEQILIDILFDNYETAELNLIKISGLNIEELNILALPDGSSYRHSSTSIQTDVDIQIENDIASMQKLKIRTAGSEPNVNKNKLSDASAVSVVSVTSSVPSDTDGVRAPMLPKKVVNPIKRRDLNNLKNLHKFNSCTTIFTVDNTVHSPVKDPEHRDLVLRSVAHAIHTHLTRTHETYRILAKIYKSGNQNMLSCMKRVFKSDDILSEKLYPIWKIRRIPNEVINHPEIMQPPTYDELFQFLRQIFIAANLTAEIATIMLVYLERLLSRTKINLFGLNCFRLILGALMLASKIWDDQAVWNIDFKTIIADLDLAGLNDLERWWLKNLDFNVDVKRKEFVKYWFEIRELAEQIAGSKRKVAEISDRKLRIIGSIEGILLAPAIKYQKETMRRKSNLNLDMETNFPKPLTENHIKGISGESADFTDQHSTVQSYDFLGSFDMNRHGSGLKRSQSDFLYAAPAPPASVL